MKQSLPCSILSRTPFIFAAYDKDFLDRVPQFAERLRKIPAPVLLMQLGWQHETKEEADALCRGIHAACKAIPGLRVIVLANTPAEQARMKDAGVESRFCHQNAFLDERRYPLLPFIQKRFDALYIARITPFKRHELTSEIASLHLIGNYSQLERDYAMKTIQALPHAKWNRTVNSYLIALPMNQASCGLCLSAEEGAMFVSCEYLLCGIPVVNTKNLGGRDLVIPESAMIRVPDDSAAVAEAVRRWKENPPDPRAVRQSTLEKMRPHRVALIRLLGELHAEETAKQFAVRIPHKLGLRCPSIARKLHFTPTL